MAHSMSRERKMNRMDDLISRQAAIDATALLIKDLRKDTVDIMNFGHNYNHGVADAIATLKHLPSAERRGRWVKGDEMADYPRVPYKPWETYCSCCGEIKEQSNDGFCGNCGARMEAGE